MQKRVEYKIRYNILKLFIKRIIFKLGKINRGKEFVNKEYGIKWKNQNKKVRTLRPQKIEDRIIYCSPADRRKFVLEYFNRTLLSLRPQNILELGSGNGINILALAVLNPDIKRFTGIELTKEGVEEAKKNLADPPLKKLTYLTEANEETVKRHLAQRNIEFIQGNITKLPFPDASFDFIFSMNVLEQIPVEYPAVFREARRVLIGHALFFEAFWEAQENIFQRMHIKSVDYFHAKFREVEKFGFKVLKFEPSAVSKIKFRNAFLLCATKLS